MDTLRALRRQHSYLLLFVAVLFVALLFLYDRAGLDNSGTVEAANLAQAVSVCLKEGRASVPDFSESDGKIAVWSETASFTGGDISTLTRRSLAPGRPDHVWMTPAEFIVHIGNRLLEGTAHEGTFALNTTPTDDHVNLYFLDCDLTHIAWWWNDSSCTYVGYYNAILCRSGYFRDEFGQVDAIDRLYDVVIARTKSTTRIGREAQSALQDMKPLMKRSIITWIVGHEIGHAVLHKSVVALGKPAHFSIAFYDVERQADDFFANRLAQSPLLVVESGALALLGEFIEQAYRAELRKAYGLSSDIVDTRYVPTVVPLELSTSPIAVPLLVRALRIKQASERTGTYLDDTGYTNIVADNVPIKASNWPLAAKASAVVFAIAAGALSVVFVLLWGRTR